MPCASHQATATIAVNKLNAWHASTYFLTSLPSLVSRRVRSGDLVIAPNASVQIAVLEELGAPDRKRCRKAGLRQLVPPHSDGASRAKQRRPSHQVQGDTLPMASPIAASKASSLMGLQR